MKWANNAVKPLLWLVMAAATNGCGWLLDSATERFASGLQQAVMAHNDPQTVAQALPAYLLALEAALAKDADNPDLLLTTADLYNAYVGLMPDDPARKRRLTQKTFTLLQQGLCRQGSAWCDFPKHSAERLQARVAETEAAELENLYRIGTIWAAWIQARSDDWNAVAGLAAVKAVMLRVVELQDDYQQGKAHAYLAVMESLLPEALGGHPELAKQHFVRALQLAPDNQMFAVLYAKHYARMAFDRDLHDNLLKKVLSTQIDKPDLNLVNALAQQQAQQLLDSADNYF